MQAQAVNFDWIDALYTTLPGHAKRSLPAAKAIAKTIREYVLLVEMSKHVTTRDLIGTTLRKHMDIEKEVRLMAKNDRHKNVARRLPWILRRFENRMIQLRVLSTVSRRLYGENAPII